MTLDYWFFSILFIVWFQVVLATHSKGQGELIESSLAPLHHQPQPLQIKERGNMRQGRTLLGLADFALGLGITKHGHLLGGHPYINYQQGYHGHSPFSTYPPFFGGGFGGHFGYHHHHGHHQGYYQHGVGQHYFPPHLAGFGFGASPLGGFGGGYSFH